MKLVIKRRSKLAAAFISIGLVLIFGACNKNKLSIATQETPWISIPQGFPNPVYQPSNFKYSDEGFRLGKKLFYDPNLSKTGLISCASCHQQDAAFSDKNKPVSAGIDGRKGIRNSPALFNLAWLPYYMADGGITHLEIMPLAPLTDSNEMAEKIRNILNKLNKNSEYRSLGKKAYNRDSIDDQVMYWSLTQFMTALISADSKYDKVQRGEASFTETESRGFSIFKTNCSSCHVPPLFTDFTFRNNGLEEISADQGRFRITQAQSDFGKYKVPSLRNIELTAPYMHNGSVNSLIDVVNLYTGQIKPNKNLDNSLSKAIVLSESEKLELISFLRTLTDYTFINNQKFKKE